MLYNWGICSVCHARNCYSPQGQMWSLQHAPNALQQSRRLYCSSVCRRTSQIRAKIGRLPPNMPVTRDHCSQTTTSYQFDWRSDSQNSWENANRANKCSYSVPGTSLMVLKFPLRTVSPEVLPDLQVETRLIYFNSYWSQAGCNTWKLLRTSCLKLI